MAFKKKVNIFGPNGSGKTHLANILKKKNIIFQLLMQTI